MVGGQRRVRRAGAQLAGRDVAWLRQELASSKDYLQSLVDQREASTQELRAAHEEVLSSNEELQSTNEELETTKEELQSANEELTTVNEQFLARNRELDALTDDLSNFITSADLPMVTVGRDLCIRRLTPAAEKAFNLRPADVGRSIEHIKSSLVVDGIGTVIEAVIATVQPWQREVRDHEGSWWVLRVQPYRTADHRIDGATIVAVDIDLVKRSHELVEARDYALAVVQTVREPLVVLDEGCRVGLANEAFYALFGGTAATVEGQVLWETDAGNWSEAALRRLLAAACAGEQQIDGVELVHAIPGKGRRVLVLNARHIVRSGRPTALLLAIEDVTDLREAETLRIDAETLRLVDRRKDEFLGILAHELRNPLAPMRFALEILRQADGDPAKATRARQVLERQVAHMVRIVDDLLDVSRITQGKVELRKEPLALTTLVSARGRAVPAGCGGGEPHPDDLAARRTGHPERRSGAADAGDRQPGEQRREVHPVWRPHLAHRRDRQRPRPAAASTADPRPRHRDRDRRGECSRRCSTCSCRGITRSSARAPASAWD